MDQEFTIDVSRADLTPSEVKEVGDAVLVHIQKKAIDENKGYNQDSRRYRKFPRYTKEYAKKKGAALSNVDLIMSGDMFTGMDVINSTEDSVTIGFKDKTQRAKAEGNQLGSYGKDPNSKKARPFLGITKKDLDLIIKRVKIGG